MAYTTINDPTQYFQTALYTGNGTAIGSGGLTITNDGNSDLQPDMIWFKKRSGAESHAVGDSNRGTHKGLFPNETNPESSGGNQFIDSFNTDGFTVGNVGWANDSGQTYVAWQWKCNAGTNVSNTDGSITSTVQANTTAGFSIVTYSGNSTAGATVGHGLGKVPAMFIIKNRGQVNNWPVYHHKNTSAPETEKIQLDTTGVTADTADPYNDTAPTSSVFTLGGWDAVNSSSYTYVAYCFAEIKGFSKFGSYTGNNNADGTFVYTGFKPAWLMVKRTADAARAWVIHDNTQDPNNPTANRLDANTSEGNQSSGHFDFLSNGFKCRSTEGATNQASPYIYMAFAESPFVSSDGVSTTAR